MSLTLIDMSTSSVSTPPPSSASPTCARLFRPWDGKTHQDSTITSTTMQSQQITHERTIDESIKVKIERCHRTIDIDDDLEVAEINESASDSRTQSPSTIHLQQTPTKAPHESPQTNLIMNQAARVPNIQPYFPNASYFGAQQQLPTSYADLFLPNMAGLPSMPSMPYMGIDPLMLEQGFARVLAEEAQVKSATSKKQRPKKFKCTYCDVAFSNNGQLKGHIRIHTGELPSIFDGIRCAAMCSICSTCRTNQAFCCFVSFL